VSGSSLVTDGLAGQQTERVSAIPELAGSTFAAETERTARVTRTQVTHVRTVFRRK
jgi:hypothetical protein